MQARGFALWRWSPETPDDTRWGYDISFLALDQRHILLFSCSCCIATQRPAELWLLRTETALSGSVLSTGLPNQTCPLQVQFDCWNTQPKLTAARECWISVPRRQHIRRATWLRGSDLKPSWTRCWSFLVVLVAHIADPVECSTAQRQNPWRTVPPGNLVVPDSFFFQFVWFRVCCSFFSRVRLGDLLCSPQQTRLHCRYAPSEARQHHYLLPALQLSRLTKGVRLGDYRAEVTAVLKSEVRSTASRQSPLEESASQARQDGRQERTTGAVWQVCESGPASVQGWQEVENKTAHPEGNASPSAHQHLFPIRYGFCFGTASSIHATWRRAGARTGLGQSGDCCGCRSARASFMFQSCSKHITERVPHVCLRLKDKVVQPRVPFFLVRPFPFLTYIDSIDRHGLRTCARLTCIYVHFLSSVCNGLGRHSSLGSTGGSTGPAGGGSAYSACGASRRGSGKSCGLTPAKRGNKDSTSYWRGSFSLKKWPSAWCCGSCSSVRIQYINMISSLPACRSIIFVCAAVAAASTISTEARRGWHFEIKSQGNDMQREKRNFPKSHDNFQKIQNLTDV